MILWNIMSPKCISRPILTSGRGMSATGVPILIIASTTICYDSSAPTIPVGLQFLAKKASFHYAGLITKFLDDNNIKYVNKNDNPTEVPHCRPVEDFFGLLVARVYHRNRQVRDVEALKRRIRKCLQIFLL